ncbi:hypothetical protein KR054_001946, partial [Drosophila jambulina]
MDCVIRENVFSLLVRLDEWSKSSEVKPGETGRIIVTVLVLIVISYVILLVARVMATLALPALVIIGLLVIYRCVSVTDMVEGFRQLPDILESFMNSIAGFMHKAN